jgi:GDP-L-fucose synthase
MNLKGKKVLITGGTGMIGRELVNFLNLLDAETHVVTIDKDPKIYCSKLHRADLRNFEDCKRLVKGMDVVFHLAGIKGSPKMCAEKPARFSVPMMQFNYNMMESAMSEGVKWYLYTSSIGVYHPAEVLHEDQVWKTFPSENDKFAGWAKRMGELQAEAYAIENGVKNVSIVRPANVYGSYDNFDPNTAMVIPSLISKCYKSDIIDVWGDGSAIRDFIHARDVARGMLFAVENEITDPLNLGSNTRTPLKEIVETITNAFDPVRKINWDTSKPTGDPIRVLDSNRIANYGFKCAVSLEVGIKETINWFLENQEILNERYNPFTEKKS